MALQLAFTDSFGGANPQGYLRVESVTLDQAAHGVTIVLGKYRDKAARDGRYQPVAVVEEKVISTIIEAEWQPGVWDDYFSPAALETRNPVAAAYDYLKTLPAYAAALDV